MHSKGLKQTLYREIQDSGNGAAVLLHNKETREIILVKQFRLAAKLNGHKDGFLIETIAGLVEESNADYTIKKEILEETGYDVPKVNFLFKAYATPGAKTEIIYFYEAPFIDSYKINEGGGLKDELEDIEVIKINFEVAFDMIKSGEICDCKTIILLQYAKMNLFS